MLHLAVNSYVLWSMRDFAQRSPDEFASVYLGARKGLRCQRKPDAAWAGGACFTSVLSLLHKRATGSAPD